MHIKSWKRNGVKDFISYKEIECENRNHLLAWLVKSLILVAILFATHFTCTLYFCSLLCFTRSFPLCLCMCQLWVSPFTGVCGNSTQLTRQHTSYSANTHITCLLCVFLCLVRNFLFYPCKIVDSPLFASSVSPKPCFLLSLLCRLQEVSPLMDRLTRHGKVHFERRKE